ncbi:MAG TPA: glycosyltransferase family 9 protein [Verrucomicrobiae bacterium]|jgi:heptosyltransferase-1|nr:glycosyltransferase family 9 protein [Verrucomicrobiae bacterium]
MADRRFLLVRLGSLGDIVHALPAAAALRDSFPRARVDWVVETKWARVLEGNPDLSEVIELDRESPGGMMGTVRKLRAAKYTSAVDFQALYKSALLAFASGAPERIGFKSSYAREGPAAWFYTDRLNPRGAHKVEHNLSLVERAGASLSKPRFPLAVHAGDHERISSVLAAHGLSDFFVLNPGGGWRSKCWPAERYGELHRKLAERYGWRGIISFGPGEEDLAARVIEAAGRSAPVAVPFGLGPLMALLARAKFVVSADTGPLHLACALGAPVIGLFGPTDPSRNGPYTGRDAVVRNPRFCETTYRRGPSYSAGMLSITVEQVLDAVVERLGRGA